MELLASRTEERGRTESWPIQGGVLELGKPGQSRIQGMSQGCEPKSMSKAPKLQGEEMEGPMGTEWFR